VLWVRDEKQFELTLDDEATAVLVYNMIKVAMEDEELKRDVNQKFNQMDLQEHHEKDEYVLGEHQFEEDKAEINAKNDGYENGKDQVDGERIKVVHQEGFDGSSDSVF
jgi:hypothetical protein